MGLKGTDEEEEEERRKLKQKLEVGAAHVGSRHRRGVGTPAPEIIVFIMHPPWFVMVAVVVAVLFAPPKFSRGIPGLGPAGCTGGSMPAPEMLG